MIYSPPPLTAALFRAPHTHKGFRNELEPANGNIFLTPDAHPVGTLLHSCKRIRKPLKSLAILREHVLVDPLVAQCFHTSKAAKTDTRRYSPGFLFQIRYGGNNILSMLLD